VKRFLVVPLMLLPVMAHAAEGILILDRLSRWHGAGIWQSMVEYCLSIMHVRGIF
jgi:uncharacterized protein involved in response to NO